MDIIAEPTASADRDDLGSDTLDKGDSTAEIAMVLLSLEAGSMTDDGEDEKGTDVEHEGTANILSDLSPSHHEQLPVDEENASAVDEQQQDVRMDEDTQTTPKNV